jgi:DNA-binding CsgD family transcriptional regulator
MPDLDRLNNRAYEDLVEFLPRRVTTVFPTCEEGEPLSIPGERTVGRALACNRIREAFLTVSRSGRAHSVLVRGAAGSGKTELLRDMDFPGATTLRTACGRSGELSDASRLLGLAEPPEPGYPGLHALYRRAADLLERGPLALVLDDTHLGDEASLRWLDFLLRRAAEQPLFVLLAHPDGMPDPDLVTHPDAPPWTGDDAADRVLPEIVARHPATVLRLDRPGSPAVTGHLRRVAAAVACLGDTGVARISALARVPPVLTRRALDTLRDLGVLVEGRDAPIRADVLRDLGPGELARLRTRAARMLNDAGHPVEEVAAQLLHLRSLPEEWMRQTLRDAARRARGRWAHADAAGYLRHLLRTRPGDVEARLELGEALLIADPVAAFDQLERALDLARDVRTRARIACRLGWAALVIRREAQTRPLLEQALTELTAELYAEPDGRPGAEPGGRPGAEPGGRPGRRPGAEPGGRPDAEPGGRPDRGPDGEFGGEMGREPEPADRELLGALQSVTAIIMSGCTRSLGTLGERLDRTRVAVGTPAEQHLLAVRGLLTALRGGAPDAAAELARRALSHDEHLPGGWSAVTAARVLFLADDAETALQALTRAAAESRQRQDAWTEMLALSGRALALVEMAEIARSVDDARTALRLADRHASFDATLPRIALALARLAQADHEGVAETLRGVSPDPGSLWEYHLHLLVEALWLAGTGRAEEAAGRLRRCGASLAEGGVTNPLLAPWWLEGALLLGRMGRPAEAAELAEHGRALAARWDTPRARGLVLLARSAAAAGAARIELLEGALDALEVSAGLLYRLRAGLLLGDALLAAGDRPGARSHLRRVALAAGRARCTGLAVRARRRLAEAGGRLPQADGANADVLTGSERRVAELAARHATNREIADTLFVSLRTVEFHLTNVYRKLGVTGRSELAEVLAAMPPWEGHDG